MDYVLQLDFYPLVDKLLEIGEDVGLTVKLVSNCWDARTDRPSTRQRQAGLDELWNKYLVKDLNADELLTDVVKLIKPHLYTIVDQEYNYGNDFDDDQ